MTESEVVSEPEPVTETGRDRGGRPALTSAHELAEAAQRLFLAQGFDQTTVDDIAAAVGVSKRTFFRYFPTKADVLWVETPAESRVLSEYLATSPPGENYATAISNAVEHALDHPAQEREWALHRAELIFTVPAVQAQSWHRFAQWRRITGDFAAARCGQPADGFFARTVGHAVIAATLSAHEHWLAHPETDLLHWIRQSMAYTLPATP